MRQAVIYLLLLWLLAPFKHYVNAAPLELPQINVVPIKDTINERAYELFIKLPENYDSSEDKRYPVVYYTDAIWHVELVSSAATFLLEDAILVGISWQKDIGQGLIDEEGQHVSRYRDYSISPLKNEEHQSKYKFGHAAEHLAFIRKDVFSYVESHYRTNPEKRSYFGYSLGGLFGAYILVSQPDTFSHYILGSPSVRRLAAVKQSADTSITELNAKVFVSHGTEESELGPHVKAFADWLNARNDQTLSLTFEQMDGTHQTAAPVTGVKGITWLANQLQQENKS